MDKKLMKLTQQIRQGDVLVMRTPTKAKRGMKPVPQDPRGVVLAEGEATGHHHRIHDPGVCLLRREGVSDSVMTIADGIVNLVHEEHSDIPISRGTYIVRMPVQWGTEEEIANVVD